VHPRSTADDDLLTRVARLSYEVGMTHREIAETLGVSRPTATRLVSEARSRGIVEITIHGPEQLFADLEREAAEALGLDEVWLAPEIPGDLARTVQAVAHIGGRCIARHIAAAHVVAVGLSATVAAAVAGLPASARSQADIAPAAGGWGGPSLGLNPPEVARDLASRSGGRPYSLPAPVLVAGAAEAEGLRRLPDVTEALDLARRADLTIMGVGGYDWAASALGRAVTPDEQEELRAAGAVGDVSGRFFDRTGTAIRGVLDERVVGLALPELRNAGTRVMIASGHAKTDALAGALAGSLLTILVTDTGTVRELLQHRGSAH
jgi:deoxyribonucleoside regulator